VSAMYTHDTDATAYRDLFPKPDLQKSFQLLDSERDIFDIAMNVRPNTAINA